VERSSKPELIAILNGDGEVIKILDYHTFEPLTDEHYYNKDGLKMDDPFCGARLVSRQRGPDEVPETMKRR
jgi:hypothetical protein